MKCYLITLIMLMVIVLSSDPSSDQSTRIPWASASSDTGKVVTTMTGKLSAEVKRKMIKEKALAALAKARAARKAKKEAIAAKTKDELEKIDQDLKQMEQN